MKLSPLTPEEQAFAEENHSTVSWYLSNNKLSRSDWYDIVIFGYMLAVQKWFRQPKLQKYSFRTIANQTMRSCVGNERKKQERRIQTVSLDAEIPGTEGVTYGDTVTYKNLEYKGVYDMKISYNVNLPDKPSVRGTKTDEVLAIENFLISKTRNMCFEYEQEEESKRKYSSLRSYRRKNNHQDIYDMYRIEKRIYIVRGGTPK